MKGPTCNRCNKPIKSCNCPATDPLPKAVIPPMPICSNCDGEGTIMVREAGAGQSDDLAEYEPCPICCPIEKDLPWSGSF